MRTTVVGLAGTPGMPCTLSCKPSEDEEYPYVVQVSVLVAPAWIARLVGRDVDLTRYSVRFAGHLVGYTSKSGWVSFLPEELVRRNTPELFDDQA